MSETLQSAGRILLIDNSAGVTGAFNSAVGMACANSDEVILVLPSGSDCLEILRRDHPELHTISLPMIELQRSPMLLFYLPMLLVNTYRLLRIASAHDTRVVHVNDMYNLLGVMLKLCRPTIVLIQHVRLMPDSYIRPVYGFLRWLVSRYADTIVCVSDAVAGHWQLAQQARVVYDVLQLKETLPAKVQTSMPTVTMAYAANYTAGKGQQYALEALARLEMENVRIIFAGATMGVQANEAYRQSLTQLAHQLGVDSQVEFRDRCDNIEALFKQCDVVLNFSDSESLSHTCIEALYFGLPLVATDSGGPGELFVDGQSGVLVPRGDVKAMAAALRGLAQSPERRQRLGDAGQRAVTLRGLVRTTESAEHPIAEVYRVFLPE